MSKRLSDALVQLAEALTRAGDAGDWPTVARLDRQVNELLTRYQPVPAPARPALEMLRQSHSRAQAQVGRGLADLQDQIERLGNNREGLRAYTQYGDPA